MTDPKPVTRTLLLEIRDPNAGIVEVYSPSDEEMLALGWTRVPAMSTNAPATIDEAFRRALIANGVAPAVEVRTATVTIQEIPELVVGNGRANGEEKA